MDYHTSPHYHTLPYTTIHCHTPPHTTTHYHTPPYTTTHYHTLPHTTPDETDENIIKKNKEIDTAQGKIDKCLNKITK